MMPSVGRQDTHTLKNTLTNKIFKRIILYWEMCFKTTWEFCLWLCAWFGDLRWHLWPCSRCLKCLSLSPPPPTPLSLYLTHHLWECLGPLSWFRRRQKLPFQQESCVLVPPKRGLWGKLARACYYWLLNYVWPGQFGYLIPAISILFIFLCVSSFALLTLHLPFISSLCPHCNFCE